VVTVTRSAESGQVRGGPGGVVVVGTVVLGIAWVALADAETLGGAWSLPLVGGLLDGADASGTPCGRSFAVPRTDGVSPPPNSAPIAQTNNTAPTPSPVMASARRRRYTDGESGPLGSFTCGN
jgi:hypothetical protein